MILTDTAIREAIKRGDIVVDPFNEDALGSNSYDVTLGDTLLTLIQSPLARTNPVTLTGLMKGVGLDCKLESRTESYHIDDAGFVLYPGHLYLASTVEYTETRNFVPFLEGKSSLGRLGLSIHVTAGKGDDGFSGHWTMEMTVVHPLRIYAGMPVGQLIWFETSGETGRSYAAKPSAKYNNRDPLPQPSKMWMNFKEKSK